MNKLTLLEYNDESPPRAKISKNIFFLKARLILVFQIQIEVEDDKNHDSLIITATYLVKQNQNKSVLVRWKNKPAVGKICEHMNPSFRFG